MAGLILITYEVITPESAEDGDAAERGWIDEEGEKHSVQSAIDFLTRRHCVEPTSTSFHRGLWYQDTDPDRDFTTGADTYQAYHLKGWSEVEERAIWSGVTRGMIGVFR